MSDLLAPAPAPRSHGTGPGPRPPCAGRPALGGAAVLTARALRLSSRTIDALITALLLPVLLMLIFVYLFGGAIDTGTTRYVTYVVPGVLVLCAGYGAAATAVTVSTDVTGGIVDRFRSLDVGGTALLTGHVAASVVRNAVSTVLVLAAACMIGFRPAAGPAGHLAAAGVLLAFVLAFSWLAAAVGLLASSPEAASGFTFLVLFLPYPSSAFVPIGTMPSWLHGFAEHQPVTPVIEALRGLLLDQPVGTAAWTALAWSAGITAVSVALAGVLFRRRTGG
ncbi:ABC transporter permease [Streptomyces sp. enrichment culture]|uniref:ABC transporter permease n=1 Tax=Streptomyces sp. enrichment culture TaxID=1795815 RepID=UPI003F55D433